MLHVTDMLPDQILSVDDGPAAEVVNPNGRAPVCLVCEHASAAIPSSLGALGLADADRYSHAVWDIGAEELARTLSRRLDAPLVLARVSRLVYDCNRPPEREDAMPARTETIDIPGNRDLTPAERKTLLMEEAKVWLNSGEMFGPEGADFERINIACPRSTLAQALERIKQVVG